MSIKHTRRFRRFLCLDCGINTSNIGEYYVINTDLWLSVVPSVSSGMLCIGCLESRLGRELTVEDFTDCYVNKMHGRHSTRLHLRMVTSRTSSADKEGTATNELS